MRTQRRAARSLLCACLLASGLLAARPDAMGGGLLDPAAVRNVLGRELQRLAAQFAPPRLAQPPAWAQRRDPPLATLAALADIHYDDTGRAAWTKPTRARLLAAIRYLNDSIKPQRVLLLGDIVAFEGTTQLRKVKEILDRELAAPYTAVWGNHDGPGFEAVFGSPHAGVTVGGLRLVTLGITYGDWGSGWGQYGRLDWLGRELAAHPREPALVLTHDPVAMPTFANNAAVLRLLDAQPQVLGVLAGHLHVDYDLRLAKAHIGLPMFARPPHPFKVLRVYPDAILILTYEEKDGAYQQAPIYQKIDIPPAFRPAASRLGRLGQAGAHADVEGCATARADQPDRHLVPRLARWCAAEAHVEPILIAALRARVLPGFHL